MRPAVSIALAGILGACARPPSESPSSPPTASAPPTTSVTPPPSSAGDAAAPEAKRSFVPATRPMLTDGYPERYRERALPKTQWRGREVELAVVEHDSDRARVVLESPTVRFVSWIARRDLYDSPLKVVRVSPAPQKDPAASGPGAAIAPGTRLERLAEKAGWIKIVAKSSLEVHGWLRADEIGPVYVPRAIEGAAGSSEWSLASGSKILWKPGGATLAVFPRDGSVGELGVSQVGAVGWYIEIRYASKDLDVRGYVPKQQLKPFSLHGYGRGYGYGTKAAPPNERVVFAPATCLYDRPNGDVVGVVLRRFQILVHIETGENASWRELDLSSGFKVWAPRKAAVVDDSSANTEGPTLPIPLESWECERLL